MARTLTHEEARRVYDRIGARQDSQAFYEDVATGRLLRHGRFDAARSVFEFGCGTGRFARTLLLDHLGPQAIYRGVDVSPTMVRLATARLEEFGERALVRQSDGSAQTGELPACFDRFVSNYVLDLLSEADIAAVVAEAGRILRPGGLLCLSSLSRGRGPASRALIGVWSWIHRLEPRLVGGCRPIDLVPFLEGGAWAVRHHEAVSPLAIPSEVVIAERTASSV